MLAVVEIIRRSAAQSTRVAVQRDAWLLDCRLTAAVGKLGLADMHLSVIALANGRVLKAHIMRKNVNEATVFGRCVRREYVNLAGFVVLEHVQFEVKAQLVRVVQIKAAISDSSCRIKRELG